MQQTLGNYELVRLLGRGGMGAVYLARQRELDRLVALKVLESGDQEARALFVDEARISASLCHQNLPFVYDVASAGDTYFLAMEYVDGIDLRQLMASGARVPYDVVVAIVMAAASGLDHAHRKLDLVHRDVSLTNIMVTRDGGVKVIDFGIAIANVSSHLSMMGLVRGKTRYMSPEQCLGEKLDARTDVFALGIVLYELATGKHCFDGANEIDAMVAIVRGQYEHPCVANPDVPLALARVITKALATDRNARYSSAAELVDALAAVASLHGWASDAARIAIFFSSASEFAIATKSETGGTPDELTHDLVSDRGHGLRTYGSADHRHGPRSSGASVTGRTERGLLRRATRFG
jgi:serine/threonine protein kinase